MGAAGAEPGPRQAEEAVAETTVPLLPVPESVLSRLAEFGASPRAVSRSTLYQALANHSEILAGWIELAWSLRQLGVTPRRLRELMIVRGAQIAGCDYERLHHEAMARAAGVTDEELRGLVRWQESELFSEEERVGLELMEAVLAGLVPDTLLDRVSAQFDAKERIELIVTAGMYAMVPRVVDALRLPLDDHLRSIRESSASYVGPVL
jgi:4-carboxymuconolactone decarboxylase